MAVLYPEGLTKPTERLRDWKEWVNNLNEGVEDFTPYTDAAFKDYIEELGVVLLKGQYGRDREASRAKTTRALPKKDIDEPDAQCLVLVVF